MSVATEAPHPPAGSSQIAPRPAESVLKQSSRWFVVVALAIIAFGATLRIQRYSADRSLWLDEVMLALNLDNSPSEWTSGLEYHQAAPFGFMLLTRGLVALFESFDLPVEYAVRSLPLLASLGSLVLMLSMARRLLGPTAALFTLALFAAGEPSVYFSADFKPYGIDAFFTLALLASTLAVTAHPASVWRRWRLILLGSAACWLSFPSAFVLGSCSAWLMWDGWRYRRDLLRERIIAIALMGISGVTCIVTTVLPSMADPMLSQFWRNSFAPFPPTNIQDFNWYVREMLALPRDAMGLQLAGLGLLCAMLGALMVWFRDRRYLCLLIGPFVLAMLASWAGQYPWQGRLLLFTAPILAIFGGIGFDHLRELLALRHSRIAALIVTCLMLMHPVVDGTRDALNPPPSQEMRQVLERMGQHILPDDLVYLYYGSVPAWRFYSPRLGLQDFDTREGTGWKEGHLWGHPEDPDRWIRFAQDCDDLDGKSRVWVVMSHIWRGAGVDDERLLRYMLDERGQLVEAIEEHESLALLYDLSAPTNNARIRSALNRSTQEREIETAHH
ncbi:MAG: hypothetical protein ACI841_004687 [Planctomycetota bacterium]|jgi:hypothetical protein